MKKRPIKYITSKEYAQESETRKLIDLLFMACNSNATACARVLDISRTTWKEWDTQTPTWKWWPVLIRLAIVEVLSGITAKRGVSALHKRKIRDALAKIPQGGTMAFDLEQKVKAYGGAEAYLRKKLAKKPRRKDWLLSAANCGGYSRSALEKAARSLEVVSKQVGYGEDKVAWWSLPDEKDIIGKHTGDD
jgi:hypothetical protein